MTTFPYTKETFSRFVDMRQAYQDLKTAIKSEEDTEITYALRQIQRLAPYGNNIVTDRKSLVCRLTNSILDTSQRLIIFDSYWYPVEYSVYIQDSDEYIPIDVAEDNYYYDEYEETWWTSRYAYEESQEKNDNGVYEYGHDVLEQLNFQIAEGEKKTYKTIKEPAFDGAYYPRKVESTLYLGVELEVMLRTPEEGASRYVYNTLEGFVLCKADSSVADNTSEGFEIVSAPATLKMHQKRWNAFFESDAKHFAGWHRENCGIHVHLSRDAFSNDAHLSKFVTFINLASNTDFITRVAGRTSESYAKIQHKKPGSKDTYGNSGDRYSAVNLQNQNTIEVRIFRSNVARLGFLKNIEFCHAVFSYTKQSSWITEPSYTLYGNYYRNGLHWEDFITWLKKPGQSKTYPNLHTWLQREDFIPKKNIKEQYKLTQHQEQELAA